MTSKQRDYFKTVAILGLAGALLGTAIVGKVSKGNAGYMSLGAVAGAGLPLMSYGIYLRTGGSDIMAVDAGSSSFAGLHAVANY